MHGCDSQRMEKQVDLVLDKCCNAWKYVKLEIKEHVL